MSTGVGLVIHGLEKFNPVTGTGNIEIPAVAQAAADKKSKVTLSDKVRETKDTQGFLSRIKEFFDAEEE
jgi:hypothetical protein